MNRHDEQLPRSVECARTIHRLRTFMTGLGVNERAADRIVGGILEAVHTLIVTSPLIDGTDPEWYIREAAALVGVRLRDPEEENHE